MDQGQASYEDLEASEIFCPACRRAQPVRKFLLIVLPTGNKYDYRCTVCGKPLASKTDNDASAFEILAP